MSEALEKVREAKGRKPQVEGDFDRCSFAQDFPLMFSILHDTMFKGKPCQSGSLIVVIEDGAYKAIVNDREMCQVAFVTGPTFNDLLRRVEEGLGDGSLDWRGARGPANGRQRTR